MKLRRRKGFTLIELIIVIAILAILTMLAAPRFLAYINDANVTSMKADAKVVHGQIVIAQVDNSAEGTVPALLKEATPALTAEQATALSTITGETVTEASKYYTIDADEFNKTGTKLKNDIADFIYLEEADSVVYKKGIKNSKNLYFNSNDQKTGLADKFDM